MTLKWKPRVITSLERGGKRPLYYSVQKSIKERKHQSEEHTQAWCSHSLRTRFPSTRQDQRRLTGEHTHTPFLWTPEPICLGFPSCHLIDVCPQIPPQQNHLTHIHTHHPLNDRATCLPVFNQPIANQLELIDLLFPYEWTTLASRLCI